MQTQYTIGEVARLLGLTTDAIRFYEKKGIIGPVKNPDNRYRCYTIYDILLLLDIIFYRHLDLSITDIRGILQDGDQEMMEQLIVRKRVEVSQKLEQQKLLLKKLRHLEGMYASLRSELDVCALREFPESVVILSCDSEDFSLAHSMTLLTADQYELCNVIKRYAVPQISEEENIHIVLNAHIAQEMGMMQQLAARKTIYHACCGYTLVKMTDAKITAGDAAPLLAWVQEQGYAACGDLLAVEFPAVSYLDTAHYFAQLYLPVQKKI